MSYFYVLPFGVRLLGLTTALSMKYAQVCLLIILDNHCRGVNLAKSLIRLLEKFSISVQCVILGNLSYRPTLILATRHFNFNGVKRLKFPPANTFFL